MKAITKYLMMMVAMLAMCVNFSSCKDDPEVDPNKVDDFVVSYSASGGGLNAQELATVEDEFAQKYNRYLNGYATNDAIYKFKQVVKKIREDFSNGLYFNGAAIVGTLTLKMEMYGSDGKRVITGEVYFTANSSDYKV